MEFWGVEVKPGENLLCRPGDNKYIHLSQVSLGHTKKTANSKHVPIFVSPGQKKLVIGHLSTASCYQFSIDLAFEKDFFLSHGWNDGSVYFVGYKTEIPDDEGFQSSDDSDEEMAQVPAVASKAKQDLSKPLKKPVVPISKDEDSDDENDDVGDESMSEDDDSEDVAAKGDGDSDEDDSSEEEETPKKKRPISVTKTPIPAKKARFTTPAAKTGGQEKGGHVDTPHPKKRISKSPASASSPSLVGVICKSCSKSFKTESALQSHSKAKHGTN